MGLHGRDWTGVAHAFASVLCLGSNQTMTRVDGVPMMMMMMMIHEKKKKKQTMTNNKRAYFVSTLYNRIMIVILIVIVKLVAVLSNLRLFVVAFAVVRC